MRFLGGDGLIPELQEPPVLLEKLVSLKDGTGKRPRKKRQTRLGLRGIINSRR